MCLAARLRKWGPGQDQGQAGTRARLGPGSASDPAHHLGGPTAGRAWASHGPALCSSPLDSTDAEAAPSFYEKSFSLFPSPTENPIDQPIDDGHDCAQAPGLAHTQACGKEWDGGTMGIWCRAGSATILAPNPSGPQFSLTSPARCLGMHSLKESLALHRAFIETKMDSGRWGHSMTLSFSSVSACVPHYTCLPPPVSMPPSFSPPSSPSGKYQRPRPLCCLRGWKPRHHQTSPNPGLTFLNVNQTL